MHSTSDGRASAISPDVVQDMRSVGNSTLSNGMTQSFQGAPVVSSIQLMSMGRYHGSDSDEKIYDDPYELTIDDDDWINAHMHGVDSGGMIRSRSWLCCPNSTTSTVVAGGGEEWRRRNDIIRGEYSSLVTTQPARGADISVNAILYSINFRYFILLQEKGYDQFNKIVYLANTFFSLYCTELLQLFL